MRTCPRCERHNANDSDFCICGEYLRWEPTRRLQAVAPAGAVVAPPSRDLDPPPTRRPRSASSAARLLLRLPGEDVAREDARTISVRPGEQATLVGVLRNESGIVDNYDISVRGLPRGWWSVSPSTVYLVPYGSDDAYEQEIEIHLHPPRTAEAQAKDWPIEVAAVSRASGTDAAKANATARIEPYQDLAAKIAPDRASGRFKARFVVTVRNRANAPVEVSLEGRDAEGECRIRLAQPSVTVPAGKAVRAQMTVLSPKQIWLGRARDRVVSVTATPVDAEQAQSNLTATFRQRAWLPWWLSLVVPLAAALAAVAVLFFPKQVIVPNLKRAGSVFAAEKLAIRAGLTLSPQVAAVPSRTAKPGTIIDQTPAAGRKVRRGSSVHIAVATGSHMARVPRVVGSSLAAANTTLRAAHLALGAVSPQTPDSTGSIASQIPAAGAEVAEGTAVQVFLKPPESKAAAGHRGGSKAIVLPTLAGGGAATAATLMKLGFVPAIVRQFSSLPAGQLVATNPAPGSSLRPGATVRLVESAGYPEISYDDGSRVHVVGGASGAPSGANPRGQKTDEATWTADGQRLVYVQGESANSGRLMSYAPNQPGARAVALTAAGSNVRDPAPAPNGQTVAFIDRSQGFGRLCFATIGTGGPINTDDCTSHPGYDLGGQISWSPGGKAILVFGVNRSDGSKHGLLEFRSTTAFSPNATAWDQGSLATRNGQDVITGAFSPDGKHVALISDFNRSTFHLFVEPANVFDITKATVYAVEACQVSWRSDGQAVAVMQSTSGCAPAATGAYPTGNLVTLTLADSNHPTIVASNAENPSWQPLRLTG
jgi:beta-lactam-binding protein with PASTA domain